VCNSLGRDWAAFGLWGYGWSSILSEKAWILGWNTTPPTDMPHLDVNYSVTPVEETPGREIPVAGSPTICRGVLNLGRELSAVDCRPVLLNASGRCVLDLHPGENNVSGLSPGVYFLHSTIDNRHASMTKVIITR